MELALRPYAAQHLDLLRAQDAAEMTAHLGGPEGEAKVRARHERYLALREAWMLVIDVDGEAAGTVGAWPTT